MTQALSADWHVVPSKSYDLSGKVYEPRAASPSRGWREGSTMAAKMEQRVASPQPLAASSITSAMSLATVGSPAARRVGGKGGGACSPHRNAQDTRPW